MRAAEEGKTVIILTHFAPLMKGTSDPMYESQTARGMNYGFASSLETLFLPHLRLWAFGHTHWTTDFEHGKTRVVSNPRDYRTRDTFRPDVSYSVV
jgi:hypothetical protein